MNCVFRNEFLFFFWQGGRSSVEGRVDPPENKVMVKYFYYSDVTVFPSSTGRKRVGFDISRGSRLPLDHHCSSGPPPAYQGSSRPTQVGNPKSLQEISKKNFPPAFLRNILALLF